MTKTQSVGGSGEDQDDAEVSTSEAMHLTNEDQLPAKVANVSGEELRKYMQCKRVGNYLLGKTVGEGSFAKVKEAFHILTGEKVAIKIIDKNRARKDRYVSKNMRREARLLQMIRHPHIVQLLEIVETSQCYYLVFEFADGGDLMDYICKHKKLKEEEVRKFVRQIISAMEYLHRLGIIHRDLKVENLLLDAKKNIKIIDFGLSNTIRSPDPAKEDHCSTQCGSPAYAAPELLVRKDYGPQIDVWSIGVNLYAMLTGRLPYTVEPFNISTLYNKMLKRQMNVVPDNLSEGCKDFIHQLLNPNPKERIKILESTQHRWITNNQKDPLQLTTCPNYLTEEDLEEHILDHVESRLKLNSDEVIRDVIQNRATKSSCVYHLLVRRLERYKREYEGVIMRTPPVKVTTTEDQPMQEYTQPSNNCSDSVPSTRDGGGLQREQISPPKVHIEETPFKVTKIALIRQRNTAKNKEKSKSATKRAASSSSTTILAPGSAQTSTPNDAAKKHKLCQIKRVALVKISPARRSFRGMPSGSRSSISNPNAGRRSRSHFEVLQRRRKCPKVRRRHAEPDDSLSSVGSVSRVNVHVRKPPARRRSHENTSHDKKCSKHVANGSVASARSGEEHREKLTKQMSSPPRKEPEEKSLETVTHFYTDKGVVLKRDSPDNTCNTDRKLDVTAEQDVVQHHVFHSQDTTRNTMDRQEPTGSNDEHREKITARQGEPDVYVVNVKIASTAAGRGVEKPEKLISPRPDSSATPAQTQNTHVKDPPAERSSPLQRRPEEKPATPRRSPSKFLNSTKIPVPDGKNSPCRQPAPTPTRLAPRASSHSTGSSRPARTAAKKAEVRTLVDKYTKCFSVVVVNRPSAVNDVNRPSAVNDVNRPSAVNDVNRPSAVNDVNRPSAANDVNSPSPANDVNHPSATNDVNRPSPANDVNSPSPANDVNRPSPANDVNRPSPRNDVNRPSARNDVNRPSPANDVNRPSPANDVNSPSPANDVNRPSPVNDVNRPSPANDVNSPSPANDVNRPSPVNDVNRPSPANDVNRPSPANGVNRPSPANDVNRPSPANDVNRPSPANDVNRPSPANDVNRPSAANDVGFDGKAGMKDKDKVAVGGKGEEKYSVPQLERDEQILQRKQSNNKSEETRTQSAEKHQPQGSSKDVKNGSTLTTKNSTTNISRTQPTTERKLPTTERTLPTTERTLPTTERKSPTTVRKLPTTVRKLPTTERTRPTTIRTLPTTERKSPTTVRTLPTTERKLPTTERKLPTTERKLPTEIRKLPTEERTLPTTERKLPTTERKLPTTERKLPTTIRKLPTPERKLQTAVREFITQQQQQSTQTKQAAPWVGDERRKISNYRKTSNSPQIKTTITREINNASTNYRSMLRPCSIK